MPGRQGICAMRNPIPLAGAPTSVAGRHGIISFVWRHAPLMVRTNLAITASGPRRR